MQLTRETIENRINEVVAGILIDHDFLIKREEGTRIFKCLRRNKSGYDYTTLPSIRYHSDLFTFHLTLFKRINAIEQVWQDLAPLINIHYQDAQAPLTFHVGGDSLQFPYTEDALNDMQDILTDLLTSHLLPDLATFSDIKKLDAFVNTSFPYDEKVHAILGNEGLIFKRIAIARFAGNPNFEDLCDFIRSSFDWYREYAKNDGLEYFANYPVVFEKVYERLKSNIH